MATPSRGRGGQTRGRGRGRSGYNTSYSSRGASANDNIDDLTRQFGGLNTGPQTSGQSYSRLARGSRPAYRAKSRGGPRPWPGPRKQSAFVFFFLGEKLYVMRNITNELGTPGGVRWDEDDSLVVTIKRKFSHEVGKEIPKGEFSYFDWRDHPNHMVRFYCKTVTRREADALPIGNVDNDSEETECLWLPWEAQMNQDPGKIRQHILRGLQTYQECLDGKRDFDGTDTI